MIYFIDGYNFLFLQEINPKNLESARIETLEFFLEKAKERPYQFVIVFDAYKDKNSYSRVDYGKIEVVYTSHNQSADDYILEQVYRLRHTCAVISNDKKLLQKAKLLNAEVCSFQQFLSRFTSKIDTEKKPTSLNLDQKYYFEKFGKGEKQDL